MLQAYVHTKLVQEHQFVRAPLSARAIAPNYLTWHVQSKICASDYRVCCCLSMSNVSYKVKQDEAKLRKEIVTVTSVAVATRKSPFGTVVSYVGKGDCMLVQGILHVHGHAYVRSHVSQGMDRATKFAMGKTCPCMLRQTANSNADFYDNQFWILTLHFIHLMNCKQL